jgi:hypothetical protein
VDAVCAVAECLAQGAHVHAEIAGTDDEIAPDVRNEIALTDDFARVLDQRDQDVERAIPQRQRHAVALDLALRRRQPERPKRCGLAM